MAQSLGNMVSYTNLSWSPNGRRFFAFADDHARCHRTFGNPYASVQTYANATTVTAWAVTDALFSLVRRVEGD